METRLKDLILALIALVAIVSYCVFSMNYNAVFAREQERIPRARRAVRFREASDCAPREMNYQGYLLSKTDDCGVSDTLDMYFRIYDSEQGGTELWAEPHASVAISNGLFNLYLGSIEPFPRGIFNGAPRWLQTEIAGEVLSPRKKIVSVAYSLRSCKADTASYAPPMPDDDWLAEGDNIYRPSGNVGIRIHDPVTPLEIGTEGESISNSGLNGVGLASGPSLQLLEAGAAWDGGNAYTWLQSRHRTSYTSCYSLLLNPLGGNVGIGTTTPTAGLEVNGDIKVTPGNGLILGGESRTEWPSDQIRIEKGLVLVGANGGETIVYFDTPFPAEPVVVATYRKWGISMDENASSPSVVPYPDRVIIHNHDNENHEVYWIAVGD